VVGRSESCKKPFRVGLFEKKKKKKGKGKKIQELLSSGIQDFCPGVN